MNNEEDLKETFDLFDRKSEGALDIDTTKQYFNSFGIDISNEELNNLSNGQELIKYDKIHEYIIEKMNQPSDNDIENYFKNILSKKTGELSVKKFKKYLMNYGIKFTEEEVNEFLKEFKIDTNGNINWKEFCNNMK